MRPLIFDVQRFSIHDGPGIRTVVFFKGCNLTCPWCQNPESMALKHEIAYYPDRCIGSHDCVDSCSGKAITFDKTFHIDRRKCADCDDCTVVCHSEAIRLIGREYRPEDLLEEIVRDMDYYETSGGGVTFSGGEPTLHHDFLYEMLVLCKEKGIHTNIETNGYFNWQRFEKLLPLLDMIYFDIKIADKQAHKEHLSKNNDKIIFNIEQLAKANAPVEFRIPLIPEYTATPQNLSDIFDILKKNNIEKVHLLPYHSMGESKGEKVDSPLAKLGFNTFSQQEIKDFQHFFEKENIQTILYH